MTEPRDLEAAYRAAQPGEDDAARARRRAAVLAAVNGQAAPAPVASNDSHWRRLPRWGGGVVLLFIGVMSGLLLQQAPEQEGVPQVREPAAAVPALPSASEAQDAQAAAPAKVQADAPKAARPAVMHAAPMRPRAAAVRTPEVLAPVPPEPMPMVAPAPMPAPVAVMPAPARAAESVIAPPAPIAALRRMPASPAAADLPMDADGRTPLIQAVRAGDVARVRELLQQGANREVRDHFGKRAADYALDAGASDMLDALQSR